MYLYPRQSPSRLILQGALDYEIEKGFNAIVQAAVYIEDLRGQYTRWEDDGGTVGHIPYLPPFPK